jgi:predicted ribosome quality control (RQC) complex YloA/Tae2 family protein
MKKDISAIELHYLVKEFSILEDCRLNSIYQNEDEAIFLVFHKPNTGKVILKINRNFIYLAKAKESTEQPKGFCMLLRKYLENSRLRALNQVGSERILEFEFETKEGQKKVYVELFGQGNIVLCDAGKIVGCFRDLEDKERILKRNEIYKLPTQRPDIFELNLSSFKEAMRKAKQETLVKKLASDLGFGGMYAEELCLIANVDKKAHVLEEETLEKLFSCFGRILSRNVEATIILDNEDIQDITPFKLSSHQNKATKQFPTFSEALDFALSRPVKKESKYEKEIKKYQAIVAAQDATMKKIAVDVEENMKIGNKIYESFTTIDAVLQQAREAKKKIGLKAMKEKAKDSKIIKDVKEDGKLIICLE